MKRQKTIKATELTKRVEKLADAKIIIRNQRTYNMMQKVIQGEKQIRTVYSTGGSWRSSKLIDETMNVVTILQRCNMSYSVDNDAPRGGRTGEHVVIYTKVIK